MFHRVVKNLTDLIKSRARRCQIAVQCVKRGQSLVKSLPHWQKEVKLFKEILSMIKLLIYFYTNERLKRSIRADRDVIMFNVLYKLHTGKRNVSISHGNLLQSRGANFLIYKIFLSCLRVYLTLGLTTQRNHLNYGHHSNTQLQHIICEYTL